MKSIFEIVTILTFVFCFTMLQSMDKPCGGFMQKYPPPTTLNVKDTARFSFDNTLINGQKVEQANQPCNRNKANSVNPKNNETFANRKEDSAKGSSVVIPAGYYAQQ
jgi:hypothetical protein